MDIEANAGSDLASDSVSTPEVENSAPAPSTREAIERAMQSVGDAPTGRARDEAGRFAANTPAEGAAVATDPAQVVAAPDVVPQVPQPPARFAKAAQEAWAQAPEAIRTEVIRLEAELTQGIEKYKGAAEAFEPLRRFDEMARQGGTTLDQALSAYTNMENMIRQDPVAGFMEVCRNAGIDPVQMGQALAGQQPSGGASPEVASLKAEIASLRNEINGVGQTLSQRDVMSQVESFAKDNPRFDELSGHISEMLSTGYAKTLQDAYEKAERLQPAPAPEPALAAVPKTPDPAQTHKASLSITGSPANGSNPGSRKPAGSTREALTNAFAQVGLS